MSKVTLLQTNFTAGEISPRCIGRVDVNRYQNGALRIRNCLVDIYGGAFNRPGSLFVAPTKFPGKKSILIEYIYSRQQAYALEFGDRYMRVYVAGGGQVMNGSVPYEITTPYTEAMLDELDFTQGADTMFLFHNDVFPQSLKRIAPNNWLIGNAPFVVLPFDEIGDRFSATMTLSAASGNNRTATANKDIFLAADVGRRIVFASGIAEIISITSTKVAVVNVISTFSSRTASSNQWVLEGSPQATVTPSVKEPVGTIITLTSNLDGFRDTDVGKHVKINSGVVKVTEFTNARSVKAEIINELNAVVGAPANSWSLNGPEWNQYDGYPGTGTFFEQRLILAATRNQTRKTWASKTGLYFDFTIGTNDDDGFPIALPPTGQINPIIHLTTARTLIPLSFGGEYTIKGGIEKPLSPSNINIEDQSVYGCNSVKPVRVAGEILFVQRSNRKIRAMSYRYESDAFRSPDLTILAEHVSETGIVDMCYQQEPDSILWCLRGDGRLATLTIEREEDVLAWTILETDGQYESLCATFTAESDEVWTIVRREVNGETVRYVERLGKEFNVDSAIMGISEEGADMWSGLEHLEGKEVHVLADGVAIGRHIVQNGEVVLPREAHEVQIGLPYRCEIELLPPELTTGEGSAQYNPQRVHEVAVLLLNTTGVQINGKPLALRKFGSSLLDQPPPVYTGYKGLGMSGWSKGNLNTNITITQTEPYPMHILGVVRKLTVNQT